LAGTSTIYSAAALIDKRSDMTTHQKMTNNEVVGLYGCHIQIFQPAASQLPSS
jgi:hypothetical protein